MRSKLIILFLLLSDLIYAQPLDFGSAVDQGKSSSSLSPTCGVYTYKPRVSEGYYIVDFYARCYSNTAWDYTFMGFIKASNIVGSFEVALDMQVYGDHFNKKFEKAEFDLDPIFALSDGSSIMLPDVLPDVTSSTTQLLFTYKPNSNAGMGIMSYPASSKIVVGIPLHVGQLRMKIKAGINPAETAGFIITASATSAGVWDPSAEQTGAKASTACAVVGWLDGEDLNIPLTPQAEDTAPETPLLADNLDNTFCETEEGHFSVKGTALPARADACEWYVSATPKGAKINDTNIYTLLNDDASKGMNCDITWLKAGTYYVNVFAKNATEHSKDTSYMAVTVKAMPVVKLLVDGVDHTTSKIVKCAGTNVELKVNTAGLTYSWEGISASGQMASLTLTNTTPTAVPLDQKIRVTGTQNGCSARDSVTFTINPVPDVYLRPADGSSFASGETQTVEVITGKGSGFTYNWTKPAVQANGPDRMDVVIKEAPNKTEAEVEVVNGYNCPTVLTAAYSDNGTGLKVNLSSLSSFICQNGVGRLKAVISGGNGSYTCSWYLGTNPGTGDTPLVVHNNVTSEDYYTVDPGRGLTYTLKVTDGRLVAYREITLTKNTAYNAIAVQTVPVIRTPKNSQVVLLANPATEVGTNSYVWEPVARLAVIEEKTKQYPLTATLQTDQVYDVVMTNVTNGVTCISAASTTVELYKDSETNPLLVSVDPEDVTLCKNGTITFQTTITGGGSGTPACVWSPALGLSNANTQSPVFDASKIVANNQEYTLKVTKNGMTTTKRVKVNVVNAQAPVLAWNNDVYCVDSLLKLTVTGSGTVNKYNWTIENLTSNVKNQVVTTVPYTSIADAGNYKVTVIGETANCKTNRPASKTIELRKINLELKVQPATYKSGESVLATVTPSNGWGDDNLNAYTYTWTSPVARATDRNNQYTLTGAWQPSYDFQVNVKDANGCGAVSNVQKATLVSGGLTLDLALTNLWCEGGSAMITATGKGGTGKYTYTWKTLDGTQLQQKTTTGINVNDTYFAENPVVAYQVTITDESPAPLTVTKTINLSKSAGLTAPVIDAGGPQLAVANTGDQAILSADLITPTRAPYTWQWTGTFDPVSDATKQMAQTAPITGETDFSVYAVDGNGCISKPDRVKVVIDATDKFDITIKAGDLMCASASQQVGVSLIPEKAGASYHWTVAPELTIDNISSASPVITATKAGEYAIAVTVDVNGVKRTARKILTVSNDKLPVLAFSYGSMCQGDTVTVRNTEGTVTVNRYEWYVNGNPVAGITGTKLPLTEAGNQVKIKVVATSTKSCVASKEETVTLSPQPLLSWDASSDIQDGTTEIELNVLTTAKVLSNPASVAYSWTQPGNRNGDSYPVTAGLSDSRFVFHVYATENTTHCKSNVLHKEVIVAKENLDVTPLIRYAVCSGGSAVLEVPDDHVEGAQGPFTYEWRKDGSDQVLGYDSIFVAQNVTAVTKYTVVVAKIGSKKIGQGVITVSPKTGAVPIVRACDDITIASGQKAVLSASVTPAGLAYNWHWGPVGDKLSAAEAVLQSPQTETLTADQKYGVYVVNSSNCVSKVDSVEVKVVTAAPDLLAVEIVPDMELCLGNKTKFTAQVTGGSGTVTSCTWLPGKMTASSDPLVATYDATKAGKDTITVVVKKGTQTVTARKVITIRNVQVPKLEFENLAAVKCSGNILTVTEKAGSGISGNYTWMVNGTVTGNVTNAYKFDNAGTFKVKVIAQGDNGCWADTLEQNVNITATPTLAVSEEENCGQAKLVAVATNADTYTWTAVTPTVAGGNVAPDHGNIFYVKTDKMSETYKYSVVASNSAGCQSPQREVPGTVYGIPDTVKLTPFRKTIYPGEHVTLTADFTPDLAYTLNWSNTENLATNNGKSVTTKDLNADQNFTLTVSNTDETTCQVSNTAMITVSANDFEIKFEPRTVDVCAGDRRDFIAYNRNCRELPITYEFTSNYTGFTKITKTGVSEPSCSISYAFTETGDWELYVLGTDKSGSVRKDTVFVRVNPIPALQIISPAAGAPQSLCLNKGEVKVVMKATNGVDGWKFKYKLNNVPKVENFTDANHTLILTSGGNFVADSIVNSKGCRALVTHGFRINDDVPKVQLSATELTKCQGVGTDLKLVIKDTTAADYPLYVHYWLDGVDKSSARIDGATTISLTNVGTYKIDSIVSNRGCVFRLSENNLVEVKEYPETNPVLTIPDKSDRQFCEGSSVQIPVTISGGKADYTIRYSLNNGPEQSVPLSASGNIEVSGNGPLVIKGFEDQNHCGSFTLNETVKIQKNEKPALKLAASSGVLCGGELDLELTFSKGKAPFTVFYTKDGVPGQQQFATLEADRTTSWHFADKMNLAITKVVDDNTCEITGTEVVNGPTIAVDSFRLYARLDGSNAQCATADAKLKIDFAGTSWSQVVGQIQIKYDYEPIGGGAAIPTTITKSKTDAQSGIELSGIQQGTYRLLSVTDLKGGAGACSGILPQTEAERTVSVIKAPVVEIDSMDFAVRKGEPFVLGVKDLKPAEFNYSWQQLPLGNDINTTAPDYKMNGTMGTSDMKYVLKGSNRNVPSCFNTDTINIYKIPEAPTLTIDTNRTRYDLILKWTPVEDKKMISGYQIMSNKWDAYAMENKYVSKDELDNRYNTKELSAASLDTLEFFYLRAMREIKVGDQMRKYYSVASDTVGYYKYFIHFNEEAGAASNNLMPVYFDLNYMNIQNVAQLFTRVNIKPTTPVSYIRYFNYATQGWIFARQLPNGNPTQFFDIKQGMVLQFKAEKEAIFIQYGNLPKPMDMEFYCSNEGIGNNNLLFLQPSRMDMNMTKDIFRELPTLNYIRKWNVKTQQWEFARNGSSILKDFELRPVLMPLQFAPVGGGGIWKGRK